MVIGRCLSLDELFDRVKSSRQVAEWLEYLQLRDEEEVKRMKAMMGQK